MKLVDKKTYRTIVFYFEDEKKQEEYKVTYSELAYESFVPEWIVEYSYSYDEVEDEYLKKKLIGLAKQEL
jgi:hypothetical protein